MRANFITLFVIFSIFLFVISACAKKSGRVFVPGDVPTDPQGYLDASGITGGKLYDKFWATETGWNQADPNLAAYNASADFFRCKQCHGWDRLGGNGAYISRAPKTTRPNVSSLNLVTIAASKTPQELFDAIKRSTGRRGVAADLSTYDPATNATIGDQMPDLSAIFTDSQIWDLVKFLKVDAVDTSTLYDSQTTGTYPTGSIEYSNIGKGGDAANGDAIFASKCASCHGDDGRAFLVDGDEFTIGSFVRSKPNEAQQKIKFGQLGSAMGSLVADDGDLSDLYKALTDTTKYPDPAPPDPQGYLDASGITGGQLYDKFWATETGWSQSDPNLAAYNASSDFFRCKQCHGWDRIGSNGAYISRAPKTTRPNVSDANLVTIAAGKSPQELFDAIKSSDGRRGVEADLSTYDPATNATVGDQMPDYGATFTDGQIWNLVKYLKQDAIDTGTLYDSQTTGTYPTGAIEFSNIGKDGSAANGDALFASKCASCHGADGSAILVDGGEYTIGSFIRSKPNEAQHKIKFGQLGSAMGSLVTNFGDLKDIYKALTNTTAYPDPA